MKIKKRKQFGTESRTQNQLSLDINARKARRQSKGDKPGISRITVSECNDHS